MAKNVIEATIKVCKKMMLEKVTKVLADMYPDYDIDFEEDFKKIDAEKMVGGGIARPEQPIKGVKPIQVKGRKFQGIF
jgi:hypothetical protein